MMLHMTILKYRLSNIFGQVFGMAMPFRVFERGRLWAASHACNEQQFSKSGSK